MSEEAQSMAPLFRIEASDANTPADTRSFNDAALSILQQIAVTQERQTNLLEELVGHLGASQRQRATELNQWREANPELAHDCRMAAESLSHVQMEFLQKLTEEVRSMGDDMTESEFLLTEFVDRFGPRLAHLNGVLQILSQLSSVPNPASTAQ